MLFLDRAEELAALDALEAGLAVVWGRRRIGKLGRRVLPPGLEGREVVRALFVPRLATDAPRVVSGVHIVTARDVI